MLKLVPLAKIKDNPFRDKKRNPIDASKVKSLVESITSSEFWKGVYGRELTNGNVELAFGHHRLDAARAAGLKEIPIEIENFTDSDMLMRMTRENMRGELLVSLEAVSAAVKAFGSGAVKFEEVDPKTRKDALRYAPSFVPEKVSGTPDVPHPYTADTLARFLGGIYVKPESQKAQDSVTAALGILEMEERKTTGFSERVLRKVDKEDGEEKYLGAKKIIQIVSDIKSKDRVERKSQKEARDKEQKLLDQKRKLEAEQKEEAKKLEAKRQEALDKAAQARIENDKREVAKQKQKAADLEEKAKEKEVIDSIKISVIDAKVAETKRKQEEAQKAAEYSFVKRDVDCFLNSLESTQAGLFTENVKALAKRNLSLKDRQRVWEALSSFSDWVGGWAAAQFVAQGVPRYKKEIKKKK